ncbi:hypothetical protein AXF42_Ash012408 [Apostasia shenzhenica]|uniref:Uncharacterized protein n=1 Tax=Apostasia shenzhenica TaxID=1088818 RepID=A0A2I0AQP6_9ASPA|nr:hypothetical protein AXF42_Ash012408 [Apostasia shenzhenica]
MGCKQSKNASQPFKGARVISISGHVEEYEVPVTAGEVWDKPARHMLCSAAQLLTGGARPLRPDDRLEPGRIYFLLPVSVLQAGPVDLAALVSRLTAIARSAQAEPAKPTAPPGSPGEETEGKRSWRPVLSTVREAPDIVTFSLSSDTSPENSPKVPRHEENEVERRGKKPEATLIDISDDTPASKAKNTKTQKREKKRGTKDGKRASILA